MEFDLDKTCQQVHKQLLASGAIWRRFGDKPSAPTLENVKDVVTSMLAMVCDSKDSLSVETGSILVKRTSNYIDIYVHCGGFKEEECES